MQSQIPKINSANHERILGESLASRDRAGVICVIKDVVTLMPHKSFLISNFINDLIKNDFDFREEVIKMINEITCTSDIDRLISAAFTIRQLGFDGSDVFTWAINSPVIENSSLSGAAFTLPSEEVLESCRKETGRIERTADTASFEQVLYIIQIIRNFGFSIQECLTQLAFISNPMQLVSAIGIIHEKESFLYLSALILELSRRQGFLKTLLHELSSFNIEFKDMLLSLLFESFYSSNEESSVYVSSSYIPLRTDEDIKLFHDLITEDTIKIMNRISDPSKVQEFLPSEFKGRATEQRAKAISKDEFEAVDFQDREAFFKGFCYLGSPSVSHFLTYLEIYKEHFVLSEEEQRLFLSIFFEIFRDFESFRHIIVEKLVLFGIVSQVLVTEVKK